MHELVCGDTTNKKFTDMALNDPQGYYQYISNFYSNKRDRDGLLFRLEKYIRKIFTNDYFNTEEYSQICMALTVSDVLPDRLDQLTARYLFFALNVNVLNGFNRTNKHINNLSQAMFIAKAVEFDYREYIRNDSQQVIFKENVQFTVKFSFLANTLTFWVPIIKMESKFFKNKIKGYQIDPDMSLHAQFAFGRNMFTQLCPKSFILRLLHTNIRKDGKAIFKDKDSIRECIDLNDKQTILDLLRLNDFKAIARVDYYEDISYYLDDDEVIHLISPRFAPQFSQPTQHAVWVQINPQTYAIRTTSDIPYITYFNNNHLLIMSM